MSTPGRIRPVRSRIGVRLYERDDWETQVDNARDEAMRLDEAKRVILVPEQEADLTDPRLGLQDDDRLRLRIALADSSQ